LRYSVLQSLQCVAVFATQYPRTHFRWLICLDFYSHIVFLMNYDLNTYFRYRQTCSALALVDITNCET